MSASVCMAPEMSTSHSPLPLRQRIQAFVETGRFEHAITAVIVINAISLGLES